MTHQPAPHADRDYSEQPVAGPLCARCGQPALGFATINGVRYCHADERSCYTEQCHENPTHARMKARLDARKAARQAATPSTATAGSDPTQGTSRSVSARVVRASEAQVEAASDAYREVWTDAPAPGGFICSICGGPVESEPCPEHAPAAEGEAHWRIRYDEGGEPHGEVCRCERGEDHDESETRTIADAVVAAGPVADEVTRLRGELKRLGLEVAKVARERSAAEDRAERLGSLSEAYREHLEATTADWRHERLRAEAAEAERDRLAGVVARVEALADEWEAERDACLAWLADPAMHVDEHHPQRLSDKADELNRRSVALRAALSGPTPAETPEGADRG